MKLNSIIALESKWLSGYIEKIKSTPESKIVEIFGRKIERPDVLESLDKTEAVIRIDGPLSMDGPDDWDLYFGYNGTSYLELQQAMIDADEYLDDDGIVTVKINTPGGNVAGVDETWSVINKIAQNRTVSFVNTGMIASAGEWLASAATNVYASSETDIFGSIGVAVNAFDLTDYYKQFGIEMVTLTNTASKNKRPDIRTEEGKKIIQDELDEFYSVFEKRMNAGGVTTENLGKLQGAITLTENAIKLGLAHGMAENNESAPQAGEVETAMNLQEFLAQNPTAQAELDAEKKTAFAAGAKSESDKINVRIDKAKPYLSNANYSAKITNLAAQVITGEKNSDILEACIVMYDEDAEAKNSEAVKSEKLPETPAGSDANGSKTATSDDETARNIVRMRGL